jgi:hypothetical protein
MELFFLADDFFQFGFVLGLAAGAGLCVEDARRLGLAYTLAGVSLDGFGGREAGWLAFRHGRDEYASSEEK